MQGDNYICGVYTYAWGVCRRMWCQLGALIKTCYTWILPVMMKSSMNCFRFSLALSGYCIQSVQSHHLLYGLSKRMGDGTSMMACQGQFQLTLEAQSYNKVPCCFGHPVVDTPASLMIASSSWVSFLFFTAVLHVQRTVVAM